MKRKTVCILMLLLVGILVAGEADAATRWQDRDYTEGCTRVFRIVPANSTMYSALVDKYGADWVFQASTATANTTFTTVLGNVVSGQGDCILVYPGSYTLAAPVNVTKNVTIMGTAADDVTLSVLAATSATIGPLGAFTVTSAAGTFATSTAGMTVTYGTSGPSGSGAKFRNFTLTMSNVTSGNNKDADGISIPGTNVTGVVVDGVTFTGTATLTGPGHIAIDAEQASKMVVKNCRFVDAWVGVSTEGNDNVIENNFFSGTRAAAQAINVNADLTASEGLRSLIRGNKVILTGASAIGLITSSAAVGTLAEGNVFHAADPMNFSGSANNIIYIGNLGAASTGTNTFSNITN